MAVLFVPLWAQTEANFSVTRTEDGRGIRIIGYAGNITAVRIPVTIQGLPVTEIESMVANPFGPESNITTVTIPASVTTIQEGAFSSCPRLTSIIVDENNPNYSSENGILYDKAKTTLIRAPGGISGMVSIPAGVRSIGNYAFFGCSSLTVVNIPEGVTSIGVNAFNNCSSLTVVHIPASVTSIGDSAFQYCSRLTDIRIPAGLTSIGGYSFLGCTSIASISIPTSVRSIGIVAFAQWTDTQTITVEGYANQAAADTAFGGSRWRQSCNAQIVYQGQ